MKEIELEHAKIEYEFTNEYEPFKLNNWIYSYREKNYRFGINALDIFYILHKKDCAIWIDANGDICYRLSFNDEIKTTSWKKIGLVFHNFLNLDVEIKRLNYDEKFIPRNLQVTDENKNRLQYYIFIHQLEMVHSEEFNPRTKAEFFELGELTYRNTFNPTRYLKIYIKNDFQLKPSIILEYIYFLSNHDKKRFMYIINWLANMFNNLEKSSVALILISSKKHEVEILFDDIIKPLFGFEYCIEINNNDLENRHFDKLFKEKIFFKFDDISYDIANKEVKNICKDVIENNELYVECNNKEKYKKIEIFAQTLITSSKPYIPIIDVNRRNFTVFSVNNSFFKERSSNTHRKMREDLDNFASFLKSFKVDVDYSNLNFEDDDISALLDYEKNIFEIFIEALKNKDLDYFKSVLKDNKLHKELIYDFDRDRVKRSNLYKYFSIIYPNEPISSTRSLLAKLREIDEKLFNQENIKSSNSEQYFQIL